MKTIRDYLKEHLTPEEYKLACKYEREDSNWNWDTYSPVDAMEAVDLAFPWHRTDEGHNYWVSIAYRASTNEPDNTDDICEETIIALSEEVEDLKEEIKRLASTIRLASKWLSVAGMEGEYKMLEDIAKEYGK